MTPEQPEQDENPAYDVTFLDRADADIEAAFIHLREFVGDKKAEVWARGVYGAGFGLADFPGPLSHPIDEEMSVVTGRQVRRMLYQGGTRKKPIGAMYRVAFYIVNAQSQSERSGIFIMRVLHGAAESWPSPE